MKKILLALLITLTCYAQQQIEFFSGGLYNPAVPSPHSVLSYEIGDRFTDFRNLEKYIDKLVPSSDRMKRVYYGETNERRPLQAFFISSPKNLERLDAIQAANKRLTDPRNFKTNAEADMLMRDLPVIVYLSYGVHGNEASSPEAAMLTAYQLCAGTDHQTINILENAVVIIDPVVNPDGRERYVQWVNSTLGRFPNINPEALEHSEPWPSGRTNHYYFDLNRDWSWQTQQETRSRVAFYRQWMPHVHVDYHEMGYSSTYFFFPAAVPIHETLPPEVVKWGKIFGKGNAEAFDKLGVSYFVGENFDMFYPGYGDSWPTFNGAIGMTYEQAGHSRGGVEVRKPSGEILTLRERARNHFTTGMATLETSVKNRAERLQDFYKFWETGLKHSGKTKGYLISEGSDPNQAARLVDILMRQGIEVHQLQEAVRLLAHRFYSTRPSNELFPRGTYFVSLEQPQSRLAQTLIEPTTVAKDTFFYDVSAWSLPIAYGQAAYSTETSLPSGAKKLMEVAYPQGKVMGDRASYAYLIPWERNDAIKLVWRLLEKGYSLSVASRSFDVNGHTFAPGTIIINVGSNKDSLHSDIANLAAVFKVDVYATNTGLTDKGISLGSNRVNPIKKPEIAVLAGLPINSNDYGELWYLFDHQFEIPFTSIRATEFGDVDLSKYDVLILPDAGNYQTVFDSAKVDKLKRWIQSGGVVIGIENGARFLTKSKSGITSATLKSEKKDDEKSKEEKEEERARKDSLKRLTQYEKEERERLEQIPGTIFRAAVDTTHPIGYGFHKELFVLKGNAEPFELPESGQNVALFSKDSLQLSGYSTKEKAKKIADSGYIMEFKVGQGRVVLFAETVTFRAFWTSLPKLLLNSILFLPQPK